MPKLEQSSVAERSIFSVIYNILRAGVGFLTAMLLARWLGPEVYGGFAFIVASLLAARALVDMSVSQAFFTFLSQRQRSKKFVNIFLFWIAFQLAISVLIALILPDSYIYSIWQNQSRSLVVLALIAVFMQHQVYQIALSMAEANRQTIRVQLLTLVITVFHLLAIITLWVLDLLLLPLIFGVLIIEWTAASFIAAKMYVTAPPEVNDSYDSIQSVFQEFWLYCKPLIPYVWLGFFYVFFDRWLLQIWGGSEEQAYYAVALQISSVSLLATAAIIKVFWKEIAEAYKLNNISLIQNLYTKTTRTLFVLSAIISGAIIPWSEEVLSLVLGAAYSEGAFTFTIMLLYPVFQVLTQISGTVLYATENVKTFANIGYVFMAVSMLVTYLLLAPTTNYLPGMDLKSNGLAIKMLSMIFLQAIACIYFIKRLFGVKFEFLHQVIVLFLVLSLSFISKFVIANLFSLSLAIEMLIATLCYLFFMIIIIISFPSIVSLSRDKINATGFHLLNKVRFSALSQKN